MTVSQPAASDSERRRARRPASQARLNPPGSSSPRSPRPPARGIPDLPAPGRVLPRGPHFPHKSAAGRSQPSNGSRPCHPCAGRVHWRQSCYVVNEGSRDETGAKREAFGRSRPPPVLATCADGNVSRCHIGGLARVVGGQSCGGTALPRIRVGSASIVNVGFAARQRGHARCRRDVCLARLVGGRRGRYAHLHPGPAL